MSNNTNREIKVPNISNITPTGEKQNVIAGAALNQSAVQSLGGFMKGLVTSAVTTIELEGKIVKIEKNGGVTPSGFHYSRLIKIQAPNGLSNTLMTNLEHKDIIEATQEIKDENKKISFDDLNINDEVVIQATYDLLKDPTIWFMKMTIIKINK